LLFNFLFSPNGNYYTRLTLNLTFSRYLSACKRTTYFFIRPDV